MISHRFKLIHFFSILTPLLAVFSGCNGSQSAGNVGKFLGTDSVSGSPAPIPSNLPGPAGPGGGFPRPSSSPTTTPTPEPSQSPTPEPSPQDSCRTSDPNHICIAVKYVVYVDDTRNPIVSQSEAASNIQDINSVWAQCDLGFRIERYLPVVPSTYGLRYQTANFNELDDIRNAFSEDTTFLIVTTGTWDRRGSLGSTGANAWTSLPGRGPYGAILERPVGLYPNIIGHELGHYLNLDHIEDSSDLMNAIIYQGSRNLYGSQCRTVRSAAYFFWQKMLR